MIVTGADIMLSYLWDYKYDKYSSNKQYEEEDNE